MTKQEKSKDNKEPKETLFRKFVRNVVNNVERIIIKSLILLMSLLLVAATAELAYQTFKALFASDIFLINSETLMDLFGVFLLVLIGIELLDTIKVYFKKNVVHVEVVILVAVIAIARKVIVLDFADYTGLEIIGIGILIITLTLGYYLIKKAGGCKFYTKEQVVKDPKTNEPVKHVKEKTRIVDDSEITKPGITKGELPPDDTPCGGKKDL